MRSEVDRFQTASRTITVPAGPLRMIPVEARTR